MFVPFYGYGSCNKVWEMRDENKRNDLEYAKENYNDKIEFHHCRWLIEEYST